MKYKNLNIIAGNASDISTVLNTQTKSDEASADVLRIFSYSGAKLTPVINLTAENGHEKSVKGVAWAPQNGRVYHTIGNLFYLYKFCLSFY